MGSQSVCLILSHCVPSRPRMRRGRGQHCAPGRLADRPSAGDWGKYGEQLWPLCQGSCPGLDGKWGWAGAGAAGAFAAPWGTLEPHPRGPPGRLRGLGAEQRGQSLPSPRPPGSAPGIRCQDELARGGAPGLGLDGPDGAGTWACAGLGPSSLQELRSWAARRSPIPLLLAVLDMSPQGCKLWAPHPRLQGHKKSGRRHRCLGSTHRRPMVFGALRLRGRGNRKVGSSSHSPRCPRPGERRAQRETPTASAHAWIPPRLKPGRLPMGSRPEPHGSPHMSWFKPLPLAPPHAVPCGGRAERAAPRLAAAPLSLLGVRDSTKDVSLHEGGRRKAPRLGLSVAPRALGWSRVSLPHQGSPRLCSVSNAATTGSPQETAGSPVTCARKAALAFAGADGRSEHWPRGLGPPGMAPESRREATWAFPRVSAPSLGWGGSPPEMQLPLLRLSLNTF